MIRQVCVCCQKVLSVQEADNINADSGEICPKCLRENYPDAYKSMKEKGLFTPQQIAEAEKD